MCACKFRQTVKPAITTILPVCRCRHRDETARDSGPGTSEKLGCHPTQTRPPGTNNHHPLEAKRIPQPAQNPHLVINVHGRSLIRSANPRCRRPRPSCIHGRRILQPPHAHPKRAGPATRHDRYIHEFMFVLLKCTFLCMYLPQAVSLPPSLGIEADLFPCNQLA